MEKGGATMEIIIGHIEPLKKDLPKSINFYTKSRRKNRRYKKMDRRVSVRDGIFVSLSHGKNRRNLKDRRTMLI